MFPPQLHLDSAMQCITTRAALHPRCLLTTVGRGLFFLQPRKQKPTFFCCFRVLGLVASLLFTATFLRFIMLNGKTKQKSKRWIQPCKQSCPLCRPSVHSVLLLTCLALCQTKTQTQIDKSKDGLFLCVSACASSHPLIWSFSLLNSLLSQSNKAAGLVRLIQTQIHMNIVIFDVVPWLTLPDTGSLKWPFVLQKKM